MTSQQRSIDSLELLLKAGADINAAGGRRQQTPLAAAAFWGWNDVVQYLFDHGAKLDVKDSSGMSPVEDTAALLRKLGAK